MEPGGTANAVGRNESAREMSPPLPSLLECGSAAAAPAAAPATLSCGEVPSHDMTDASGVGLLPLSAPLLLASTGSEMLDMSIRMCALSPMTGALLADCRGERVHEAGREWGEGHSRGGGYVAKTVQKFKLTLEVILNSSEAVRMKQ